MTITLLTGASSQHYAHLCRWAGIVQSFDTYKVIVYNLGLSTQELRDFRSKFPDIIFKKFYYDRHPAYLSPILCTKPQCILDIIRTETPEILLWMDPHIVPTKDMIEKAEYYAKTESLYTEASYSSIKTWCHPKTAAYLNVTQNEALLIKKMRDTSIIALQCNEQWIIDFCTEWAALSSIQACVAPEEANLANHRYDSTIFSILYYRYRTNFSAT